MCRWKVCWLLVLSCILVSESNIPCCLEHTISSSFFNFYFSYYCFFCNDCNKAFSFQKIRITSLKSVSYYGGHFVLGQMSKHSYGEDIGRFFNGKSSFYLLEISWYFDFPPQTLDLGILPSQLSQPFKHHVAQVRSGFNAILCFLVLKFF